MNIKRRILVFAILDIYFLIIMFEFIKYNYKVAINFEYKIGFLDEVANILNYNEFTLRVLPVVLLGAFFLEIKNRTSLQIIYRYKSLNRYILKRYTNLAVFSFIVSFLLIINMLIVSIIYNMDFLNWNKKSSEYYFKTKILINDKVTQLSVLAMCIFIMFILILLFCVVFQTADFLIKKKTLSVIPVITLYILELKQGLGLISKNLIPYTLYSNGNINLWMFAKGFLTAVGLICICFILSSQKEFVNKGEE